MIQADVVIFGGGIGGLWFFSELTKNGYSPILIESQALGSEQTLASQGMIHGGQRYSLTGALTDHTQTISAMPKLWSQALSGKGPVDLSSAKKLSESQWMWVPGGLISKAIGFFASQAMDAHVKKLNSIEWPSVFSKNRDFQGTVYHLPEDVLDVKSVLQSLRSVALDRIIKASWDNIKKTGSGYEISISGQLIKAQAILFSAGKGNEKAAQELFQTTAMTQRRPLRQVLVRELDEAFYGHCITHDPRPRATITSHPLSNGKYVWYLGGLIATYGTNHTNDEALIYAKKELTELFPHIEWSKKEWATYEIDRAEPKAQSGFLPDGPELKTQGALGIGWPTKMTFAPGFSTKCMNWIQELQLKPVISTKLDSHFELAQVDLYPWEKQIHWQVLS